MCSIRKDYEIEPNSKHYGCFVDLLCRTGLLNEAYKVIINMQWNLTRFCGELC